MRTRIAVRQIVYSALVCLAVAAIVQSQSVVASRRAIVRVSPEYPELARRMRLSGRVKIEVTIASDGAVQETKVIGGHPILVNSAVDAVKKWRFESGSSRSTAVVEFKFSPPE
jgi:TonB family protein